MTIEEFNSQYKSYVIKWIDIKNNTFSNFYIKNDEFYSEVINKLFIKKKIEDYNPDFISSNNNKTSFKAWLSMVLNYLHIDLYRLKRFSSLEEMTEIKGDSFHPTTEIDIDSNDSNILVKMIFKKIKDISEINYRVLIKLKLFIKDKTQFKKEEFDYMQKYSKLNENDILKYIDENQKNDFGLKNKHITELTEFKAGSISTIYDRIVRKLNIQTYKY